MTPFSPEAYVPDLAIETTGLIRCYGSAAAVDGISLRVPSGSIYGFLGPNGAGKTTTIRLLLGLIKPSAGTVRILGKDLRAHRALILSRVGALVETPALYSHLTGKGNLEVTARLLAIDRERIDDVLHTVGLADDADKKVGAYSTGMKQRLGLALTLINRPAVLILDEPTNGLDPQGIREVRDLIQSFPQRFGVTVFLSSHLLSEVEQIATHIGIIHNGRLRFQGTLQDLHGAHANTVVLRVDNQPEAIKILSARGWVITESEDQTLRVRASTDEERARMNAELIRAGIQVYQLSLHERSLEDIFVQMTTGTEGGGA